jgi:hypothetical protein
MFTICLSGEEMVACVWSWAKSCDKVEYKVWLGGSLMMLDNVWVGGEG